MSAWLTTELKCVINLLLIVNIKLVVTDQRGLK